MATPIENLPDAELAHRVAKLWPHREHESNIMLGQLCRLGLHSWRRLDLEELVPARDVRFCFWCARIRLDGAVHNT